MASEDAGKSESFGSAAHLMIEALDKASQELEQTVRSCLDQVAEFSDTLEKQLISRLQKVVDQSGVLDNQIDEMSNRKEEFIERLNEFERTEVETVSQAAKEVRQQITAKAQQATDSIHRLVEEQLVELRALMENPNASFNELAESKLDTIKDIGRTSKDKLEDHEASLERRISDRSEEFDKTIQGVIDTVKRESEERLSNHNTSFEARIQDVLSKLNDIVSQTALEIRQQAQDGTKKIEGSTSKAKSKLNENFGDWESEIAKVRSGFDETLKEDRKVQEEVHHQKLERKGQDVREEIEHIAQDATIKIAASHKLFYSSLKRLEKKYFDRLDRLFSRFENALAQESNMAGAKMQSTSELRLILSARLQARGDEVVKAFQRQIEQIESEYVRSSQGYHERIETIKTQTVESLDKQMRQMAQEMERITRNFNNGLADLNLELPHVEERGRAAALAVKAYRSAMLSLGGDFE